MAVFAASHLAAGRLYGRYGPRWVGLVSHSSWFGGRCLRFPLEVALLLRDAGLRAAGTVARPRLGLFGYPVL